MLKQHIKVIRDSEIEGIEKQLTALVNCYYEIEHLSCMHIKEKNHYVAVVVYSKSEPLL